MFRNPVQQTSLVPNYLDNLAGVVARFEEKHQKDSVPNLVPKFSQNKNIDVHQQATAARSGSALPASRSQLAKNVAGHWSPSNDLKAGHRPSRQGRSRYFVREGDSLESIAAEQLGDPRFAQLLLTINRAEVITVQVAGKLKFSPVAGKNLLIPSDREVAVHRKHFFCTAKSENNSGSKRRANPSLKASLAGESEQESIAKEQILASLNSTRSLLDQNPIGALLSQLRTLGNRTVFSISQPRINAPARQCIDNERPQPQREFIAAYKTPHVELRVQPETKLSSKNTTEETEGDFNPCENFLPERSLALSEHLSFNYLSNNCRLLLADQNTRVFSIKLQTLVQNQWKTIASYESSFAHTVRNLNFLNGERVTVEVDLPIPVAREMAREDFYRNWRDYYQTFLDSALASNLAI